MHAYSNSSKSIFSKTKPYTSHSRVHCHCRCIPCSDHRIGCKTRLTLGNPLSLVHPHSISFPPTICPPVLLPRIFLYFPVCKLFSRSFPAKIGRINRIFQDAPLTPSAAIFSAKRNLRRVYISFVYNLFR